MTRPWLLSAFLLASHSLLLAACGCDTPPPEGDAGPGDGGPPDAIVRNELDTVPETARFMLPGLAAEAAVLRTELDVPHIYAADRVDGMRVLGFVMARDRFFQMDLTRRLSQGRLSELLGDAALATDLENRMTGGGFITDRYVEGVNDEEREELTAFAEGVNAYIEAVRTGLLPAPSELVTAAPFLGARRPVDLMHDWTLRDVIATGTTVLFGTSFETGDVGRDRDHQGVDDLFVGFPDRALRLAGVRADVIDRYAPPRDSQSAAGWGLERGTGAGRGGGDEAGRGGGAEPRPRHTLVDPSAALRVHSEASMIDRLRAHLDRIEARSHDSNEGYGSNVWAVAGASSATGESLLAGDGHLQLSVPALFWQFGLDTAFLSTTGEGQTMLGSTIAGLPAMGVGTNGHVAWSQTAYFSDVTDWYAEEITLDGAGMPASSRFMGAERALVRVVEPYEVANVPALGSVGRTEMLTRFTTFDGRWITAIEGRSVTADEPLGPGESRINLMGDWIVPQDMDGDTIISAVSFDYVPLDGGTLLRAFRQFSFAQDVEDYRDAMRHFIGYGGNMIASDADGNIFYSAYHATPCRDYLPHVSDGGPWVAGADPRRLLDGTTYGGFTIPLTAEGHADESMAADPYRCVVPFEEWPMSINRDQGFVMHANNDPAGIATDGDLFDDPYYIGGPWIEGYRAARIEERLRASIAADTATLDEMRAIQGDHHSNLGEEWVPFLLDEIAYARGVSTTTPTPGSSDARVAATYTANQADLDELEARLSAWRDAGYPTPSGVETFYNAPAAGDVTNAVATMLFGVVFPRFVRGTLDDERIPGGLSPAVTGDTFRMQTMLLLVGGRGPGNPNALGSYDPVREESVFFDDVATPDVETSHEIALRAMTQGLAFLRSEPTAPGRGGFGSDDWDSWIWGLRHGVRFESLLADFLGDDPMFSFLVDAFAIGPERLPLAPGLVEGDPRFGLTFFPRPGDQFDIDAANPGLSGERFTHGSGPVFRMVIALGPEGVRGYNVIPGGQSGLTTSEHFDDQAALWIGNDVLPMRFTVSEVVAGATARDVFLPAM